MKTLKKLLPSTADFRPPTFLLGRQLEGVQKINYEKIKKDIEDYMLTSGASSNRSLLNVLDSIEDTKKIGMSRSMEVLTEVVKLIRIQLLSNDPSKVYTTVTLIDGLIKNAGYRIHILIGRRRFMKTYGLVLRRHRAHMNSVLDQRVSALMIDCIQAYGEAFTTRRLLYPFIYDTYYKIRNKYGIRFPRPDFDPTRVPIFLGEITAMEKQLAMEFPDDDRSEASTSPRSYSFRDSGHDQEAKEAYDVEEPSNNDQSRYYSQERQTSYSVPPQKSSDKRKVPISNNNRNDVKPKVEVVKNENKPLDFVPYDWEADEFNASAADAKKPPAKPVDLLDPTPPPVKVESKPSSVIYSEPLPVLTPSRYSPPIHSAYIDAQNNNAAATYPSYAPPPRPTAAGPMVASNEVAIYVAPNPPVVSLHPRIIGTNEKNERENHLVKMPFDDLSKEVDKIMQHDLKSSSEDNHSKPRREHHSLRRTKSENSSDFHPYSISIDSESPAKPTNAPPTSPSAAVPLKTSLPAGAPHKVEEVHLKPVPRKSSPLTTLPEETQESINNEVSGKASHAVVSEEAPVVPSAAPERRGAYWQRQQELKRTASMDGVSSDHNVDIRFFGNQRVVSKRF